MRRCPVAAGRGAAWSKSSRPAAACGELALWAPLVARLTHAETAALVRLRRAALRAFCAGLAVRRARGSIGCWWCVRSLRIAVGAGAMPAVGRLRARHLPGRSAAGMTELRRLALAAERGASLGVLIRPLRAARRAHRGRAAHRAHAHGHASAAASAQGAWPCAPRRRGGAAMISIQQHPLDLDAPLRSPRAPVRAQVREVPQAAGATSACRRRANCGPPCSCGQWRGEPDGRE